MNVRVRPEVLEQAAEGINGVIGALSATPVIGSYTGQTGRGFGDLELSGRQMSRPSAKEAMDDFCLRWEWGMRALVQTAGEIAHTLHLGAGMYEEQDRFAANALKDMANDLVGDTALQQESVRDESGAIVVRGTDDMSAGELFDHNRDRLANPDLSPESFAEAQADIEGSITSMGRDALQAAQGDARLIVAPVPLIDPTGLPLG